MLDLTWKLFSQTGNIETYLLLKELENVDDQPLPENDYQLQSEEEINELT